MVRIVSDTGPIIGLAKIGKIDLLKTLTDEILIPPFVHKELFGKIGPEAVHIDKAINEFIRMAPISDSGSSVMNVLAELDEGERQAIRLARSFDKDVLLLMDDYAGRKAARKLDLSVTGLIGLFILAKRKGLIENVVPLLEALRETGYWLSEEVIKIAKKLAGE